jgi:hypothetical protein
MEDKTAVLRVQQVVKVDQIGMASLAYEVLINGQPHPLTSCEIEEDGGLRVLVLRTPVWQFDGVRLDALPKR